MSVTLLLLDDWSVYSCNNPLNVWLLGTYGYLTATHLLGVIARHCSRETVEVLCICLYFFILIPFSILWTAFGTIWYTGADLACLPVNFRGIEILFVLMLSYLYVTIGIALILMFLLMVFSRHYAYTGMSFIIVPNDDRHVDNFSESMLERLQLHTSPVREAGASCPICYEDMPVRVI